MSQSKSDATRDRVPPTPASDDGGFPIVRFLLVWWLAFIAFHSLEKGRELDRLGNVQVQLAKAQSELLGITKVIREMKGQADVLDVRRATLERQVADLEGTRDKIALSLQAASKAVSQPAPSRLYGFFESVFSGLVSSFIWALIAAAAVWLFGKRIWPRIRRSRNTEATN